MTEPENVRDYLYVSDATEMTDEVVTDMVYKGTHEMMLWLRDVIDQKDERRAFRMRLQLACHPEDDSCTFVSAMIVEPDAVHTRVSLWDGEEEIHNCMRKVTRQYIIDVLEQPDKMHEIAAREVKRMSDEDYASGGTMVALAPLDSHESGAPSSN